MPKQWHITLILRSPYHLRGMKLSKKGGEKKAFKFTTLLMRPLVLQGK
jgi:hypothetical protein